MFTPISRIANVTIKGNHNVSTSEINKQLNANSGERMYTFSNSKAKAKLKDNPLIKMLIYRNICRIHYLLQ